MLRADRPTSFAARRSGRFGSSLLGLRARAVIAASTSAGSSIQASSGSSSSATYSPSAFLSRIVRARTKEHRTPMTAV